MTPKKPLQTLNPPPQNNPKPTKRTPTVPQQPLDPDLAIRLRASADERIRAQIQAAKQRADQRRQTRAEFGERRKIGLRSRHAVREARINLARHHNQNGQP